MSVLKEKLNWNREARIDHLAKGYTPRGLIDESIKYLFLVLN